MTSSTADLRDVQWLTSNEAAPLLAEIAAGEEPLHRAAERLRRTLSASRAHLVLELVRLRQRAREKFLAADRMFFTPQSLEQATDQWTAAHKADRFGAETAIADLCCGIGGDLLALSARGGPTLGVDLDPLSAHLAAENIRVCGLRATLRIEDAEHFDVALYAAWHLDPNRRPAGRRTSRLEAGRPATAAIRALLGRNGNAAVKLAPAAELPDDWARTAEREWISRRRECRQQVAWFGSLAACAGSHRATLVRDDGRPPATLVGAADISPPVAGRIGRYLFEPDAAVLAGRLTGHFALQHSLSAVAEGIAYLTADVPLCDPLLNCFEVLDVLPLDMKQIGALLRERRVGSLEIKKRGVAHDPREVRRLLRPRGDESATLILTRTTDGPRAILARRMVDEPGTSPA